jgi:hypothetical protein
VSVWWVVWSFWAYINELRDPKDVFYDTIELASSFSDLQKLTLFGCASRQAKIRKITWAAPYRVDRNLALYQARGAQQD